MHDHEQTVASAVSRLEQTGKRFGAPYGIDWLSIVELIINLFKDCGKDAARKTPMLARVRLTRDLRRAMPGATLREVAAVRETVMAAAVEATDAELDEFGEVTL